MSFKNTFEKNLEDKEKMQRFRYGASKSVFIFVSFLFFLSFFFVGAGYYKDFFAKLLSPSYILMIFSLDLFIFFFFEIKLKNKKLSYFFSTMFLLLSIGFLYIIF